MQFLFIGGFVICHPQGMHAVGYIELSSGASSVSNQVPALFNRSFANAHPPFGVCVIMKIVTVMFVAMLCRIALSAFVSPVI